MTKGERHAFPRRELDELGRTVVTVNRREIAVFSVGGELYAVFNRCPHHQAPLAAGTLWGTSTPGQVGELHYDRSRPVLRCPWHRYEFDLYTGRCIGDPERLRVATYDVRLEGDEVVLYL
jgi:3-phenylpropionate/trans-cinnamate dioxygenase ferredoxin subunit